MSRREELRLRDILEAIETIRVHVGDRRFDRKTSDAVLYNLVVIGEAAAQISEEMRSAAPEIPWAKVVGLRNLIAHEYFRVDLDVIEAIISEQLEDLERSARRLLDDESQASSRVPRG